MIELYFTETTLDRNNSIFMTLVNLSDDALNELQGFFDAKDFYNPRARELIGPRWGEDPKLSDLFAAAPKKKLERKDVP